MNDSEGASTSDDEGDDGDDEGDDADAAAAESL